MILPKRYSMFLMNGVSKTQPLSWAWTTAVLFLGLALTACTCLTEDPTRKMSLTDAKATSPDGSERVVPIVLPLQLVEMKAPLVVDFDLPPPGPNAASTLFIGFRVNAADGKESALVADRVIAAGLEADVSLMRLQDATTQPVALARIDSSGQAPAVLVPIGPEGRVVGVRRDDVDDISIDQAGRSSTAGHSRSLSLALAQNPPPGRYRLSIRIGNASPELSRVRSELLVAYRHRSK